MYAFPKRKLNVQLWDFRDHFPQIAAFWENPEKSWLHLAKLKASPPPARFWQILQHLVSSSKKSATHLAIFNEKFEIRERLNFSRCTYFLRPCALFVSACWLNFSCLRSSLSVR